MLEEKKRRVQPNRVKAETAEISCKTCGFVRVFQKSFLRVHDIKYCSRKCMGIDKQVDKINLKCHICNTEFLRRHDHVKEINFCSYKCTSISRRLPNAKWRDKVAIKEYMSAYAKANRKILNEKSLIRDSKNIEAKRLRGRKYVENNKSKIQVDRQYRRKVKVGGDLTGAIWDLIKKRYDYTCLCCNKKEPEIKLTIDHIIPITKGGQHTESNVQPLCRSCNSIKQVTIMDYRPKMMQNELKIKIKEV